MRLTQHNGRFGSSGVFRPGHNDRQFNTAHADHIDQAKQQQNLLYYLGQNKHAGLTFDQAEQRFYEMHFREHLDARNAKQVASRHPSRVQTMDQFRRQKQTCPEESIIQIGSRDSHPDMAALKHVVGDFLKWQQQAFPQARVLDMAFHADEATPHLHMRLVWIAHDKDGREYPNQNGALREMGVSRPDPSKPEGRYNNAKMTYTRQCRNKLIDICQQNGLDIDIVPRERSQSGLSMAEYQARQEEQRAAALRDECAGLERQQAALAADVKEQTARRDAIIANADHAQARLDAARAEHDRLAAKNALLTADNGRMAISTLEYQKRRHELSTAEKALSAQVVRRQFVPEEKLSNVQHSNYLTNGGMVALFADGHTEPMPPGGAWNPGVARYRAMEQRGECQIGILRDEPQIWLPEHVAREIARQIPVQQRSRDLQDALKQVDGLDVARGRNQRRSR